MKRYLKIAALIAAVLLIAGLLYFANAFLGNPVSALLAKNAAEKYIEENYSDLDVHVEKTVYSFKMSGYYARIKSETSIDTEFALYIDWFGHVTRDDYAERVESGENTYRRLDEEYRALTESILEAKTFPYVLEMGFGRLEEFCWDEEESAAPGTAANVYGIEPMPMSELVPDRLYDVRELGAERGVITIYLESETPSVDQAAEMLLSIRALFDEAGVPFRAIDMTLRPPKGEDGAGTDDACIYAILNYEDIYSEGLEERVRQSHDAQVARFAAMDAQKK